MKTSRIGRFGSVVLAAAGCMLSAQGALAQGNGQDFLSILTGKPSDPLEAAVAALREADALLAAPSPDQAERLRRLAGEINSGAVTAFKAERLDLATLLFEGALRIDEAVLPAGHPNLVKSLHNLAFIYQRTQRLAEAETMYRRALAIREAVLPHNDPEIAVNLADLGSLLANTGRPEEAEPLYERALAIREASLPANDPLIVRSLTQLADMYDIMGRYAEQEPLMRRALALQETRLPPDHPEISLTLHTLAGVMLDLARFREAEEFYRRALAIRRQAYPENHPAIAVTTSGLANTLARLGRYEEAETLYADALAMREAAERPSPGDIANSLANLGGLYRDTGRLAESETFLKRAIVLRESLPQGRRALANSLSVLADLYQDTGRDAEAEALQKRALSIREDVLPEDHPEIAISLNGLAAIYQATLRFGEAEALYKRALAMREAALPPGHPSLNSALNNLAGLYEVTRRYDEAEVLYKQALGRPPLEVDDPSRADILDNLARLYGTVGRNAEAQPLHERSLALLEAALPPFHPSIATSLNNQASNLDAMGRHAEAEPLRRRSKAINEQTFSEGHFNRIAGLSNLAHTAAMQQRYDEASSLSRQAVAATLKYGAGDLEASRGDFLQDASLALRLDAGKDAPELQPFAMHQWPMGGAAGAAIAAARARGEGSDELRGLARRADRLNEEISAVGRLLSGALGEIGPARDAALVADLRGRYDALVGERAKVQAGLADKFPSYADLARPKPLTAAEVQSLLGPREALVTFMLTGDPAIPGFVFAVTREGVDWGWIEDSGEVMRLSRDLRARMTGGNRGAQSLVQKGDGAASRADAIPDMAHRLYKLLLGPVAASIEKKPDLIFVPDPYLADLPMHILVSEAPKPRAGAAESFRAARWLVRDHTVTVLPAVSSLRALRQLARRQTVAAKPFLAFADPVIGDSGPIDCGGGIKVAATAGVPTRDATAGFDSASMMRSGAAVDGRMLADVARIRSLPRLADTRCEAMEISAALGGGEDALFFDAKATETQLKRLNETGGLADQRVLLFATHGLAPGDIGSAEPALVLTPPAQASPTDDGLLTASEVAGLSLNADFVILSACNTASAGAAGGQSFSGLARAFFYAGAKSLLVSHWPVYSDAAVTLTTRALAAGEGVSRAQAMRQAMLAMIDDPRRPEDADPVRWGPFSLVGDSGG